MDLQNSNTESATIDFTDYISKKLDQKEQVIAVFIDLKKTFDVVDIKEEMHRLMEFFSK